MKIVLPFLVAATILFHPPVVHAQTPTPTPNYAPSPNVCNLPPENQSTLKEYATKRGLIIGALERFNNDQWNTLAAREFSLQIIPIYMRNTEPLQNEFSFTDIEEAKLFTAAGMQFKGTDLIYAGTGHYPTWLTANNCGGRSPADMTTIMHEFFDAVMDDAGTTITEYEVVNEDKYDSSKPSGCFENILGVQNTFIDAFTYAHKKNPNAILSVNYRYPSTRIVSFAKTLRDQGVPIDSINIEMHIGFWDMQKVTKDMDTFMTLAAKDNFKVQISEATVSVPDNPTANDLQKQASIYKSLVATCLNHTNCFAFIFWSNLDLPGQFVPYAALFDQNYQRKPAYYGVMEAIRENTTRACNSLPGDLNGDTHVNGTDYQIFFSNFGNTTCGNVADIDGNCKVDIFDYNVIVGNFGK